MTNYYKSHKIERDNRIGIRKAEDKNGENRKDNKDSNSSKNDNGDEDRGVSSGGGQKAERLGGHGDEGGLGRGEDISVPDLMIALKEKYGKDYARTTVQTFLLKMIGKGFVQIYRRGKLSYVHALKGEADYKAKLLQEEMDFWYQGTRHSWSPVCSEPGR